MKHVFYILPIIAIILSGCFHQPQKSSEISSFEECVAAGNPVMESYPRQCRTQDGNLFVEELSPGEQDRISGRHTLEAAKETAKVWVMSSAPTYLFDGSKLEVVSASEYDDTCDTCFEVTLTFESAHGGFGDRTDKIVTQVITPHEIKVQVENGEVVSALTDGVYDELNAQIISK